MVCRVRNTCRRVAVDLMFRLQKGRTCRLNVQSAKVDVAWDQAPHWGEKKKKVGVGEKNTARRPFT